MRTPHRLSLLGVEVDRFTSEGIMDFIAESIAGNKRTVIANHNFHSLYLYHRSPAMRAFYRHADVIEIDSTPMIAWAKLLGYEVSLNNRCTYLDYRQDFWALAENSGWRIYHLGGSEATNVLSKASLLQRHPNMHLDMHTGYFDMSGPYNELLVADIVQKAPNVLLVGMGMPRQELWILKNLDRLPNCVILPVGAAMDYEAGIVYTPPRWTGRLGIEWLVRFVHEPRRLFSRYFLEPWSLLPHALRDLIRKRPVQDTTAREAIHH